MAIERLPRRELWHEIYRGASAYHAPGASGISAGTPIVCWENVKSSKLQGIVMTGPIFRSHRFNVVVRDQDHANPFTRKHYRTASGVGQVIDRANWPNSLLRWGANKEICIFLMTSGLSGEVYTADMEILTLMG